jgi:adenylyltransferase/sulfurtransferase
VEFNITPEQLSELLKERQPLRLIDVREEEEWDICRLPEDELYPMSLLQDLQEELIETEEPIVVYCHHGIRSASVCSQLRYLGKANVFNLSGGIDRWSTEIDPSVPAY